MNDISADTITMTIRLRHRNEELSTLAIALELPIDRAWKSGDPIRGKDGEFTGSHRQGSYISSTVATSQDISRLNEYLDSSCARLQPHKQAMSEFIERGGKVELLIGWFFERTSGLEIPPGILSRLGTLGVNLLLMAYGSDNLDG